MACTCAGDTHGSSRCFEINTPEQCAEKGINCTYQEGACTPCSTGTVFSSQLTTPFPDDEGMGAVNNAAREMLYDVRDLLAGSEIGDALIGYNDAFASRAEELGRANPELNSRIVQVLMDGASFARAMIRERDGGGRQDRIFSNDQFERASAVADEVSYQVEDDEVRGAIDEIRGVARGLVGLTPGEVLEQLGLGPARGRQLAE